MKLVLDAGALIGIDRNDRRVAEIIELGRRAGADLVTSVAVVAQVWRDGGRQVQLARSLPMIDLCDVDLSGSKRAGELLAVARSADVVDALVALVTQPGDHVLTSDPSDLRALLEARGVPAAVTAV